MENLPFLKPFWLSQICIQKTHQSKISQSQLFKTEKNISLLLLVVVFQGRNGLGNIYVWASGDGGEDDDCNCDGYAASMWTVSINSAINDGQNAHYDESCSSTLASTFSNGAKDPNTGVVSYKFAIHN